MPVATARKIEWFARKHEVETGIARDIQFHPIVLTRDQRVEYELPRTPIKETELEIEKFHSPDFADEWESVRDGAGNDIAEIEFEIFERHAEAAVCAGRNGIGKPPSKKKRPKPWRDMIVGSVRST